MHFNKYYIQLRSTRCNNMHFNKCYTQLGSTRCNNSHFNKHYIQLRSKRCNNMHLNKCYTQLRSTRFNNSHFNKYYIQSRSTRCNNMHSNKCYTVEVDVIYWAGSYNWSTEIGTGIFLQFQIIINVIETLIFSNNFKFISRSKKNKIEWMSKQLNFLHAWLCNVILMRLGGVPANGAVASMPRRQWLWSSRKEPGCNCPHLSFTGTK